MQNFRRVFILFKDVLSVIPEFSKLCESDKMTLGKSRFSVFYWWLLCCWIAKCGSSGVCYSNGSYFPLDTNFQPIPDLKGITELAIEAVSKPLARLCLTEEEILIGSVFAVFFEYPLPPKMPHASTQILSNARDRYIQCMINVSSCSEVQSALRLAEISLIFPSITVGKLNGIKNSKSFQNFMTPKILNFQNLVHLTSDNIKVLDAMRVLEADQLFRDVFIVKP
ncbi:NR LBD domain-containing protein [Caenorhabditis elegans]|uniref:NR LBD domain-containing protein n=1 Tax=Caenorhabditis elegans TaxID=6239 RepID=Q95XZ3_CAEEL|nr:NR LBD domain-containing protein [Caenorhabditis elegans]CCD69374.2 NR LBD domain-containing protein [Caenorhabditis elegans]|eukprot:NP_001317748.1 Uncharacterized protein CELE_Y47D7A.3 [Caenorhabditis elegans]